jgi:hypothetical protein
MAQNAILIVEYLHRLMASMGVLQERIAERIPDDLIVKDRTAKPMQLVYPGQPGYESVKARFKREVSSSQAVVILAFLYTYEKYLQTDKRLFEKECERHFDSDPGKWARVLYHFPRLDQTALATILSTISETIINYRLEDLSSVGLIERSIFPPPHPKHVSITSAGVNAIESAAADGFEILGPIFGDDPLTPLDQRVPILKRTKGM